MCWTSRPNWAWESQLGLAVRMQDAGVSGAGSTYVVEQLSFSMFPSILTFEFDLILGSFLTFWGPNGLILGLG